MSLAHYIADAINELEGLGAMVEDDTEIGLWTVKSGVHFTHRYYVAAWEAPLEDPEPTADAVAMRIARNYVKLLRDSADDIERSLGII
tara:strand:+ start:80 stop:343 length:264 start_codon:yes stop_codon:yes gene_type:complete